MTAAERRIIARWVEQLNQWERPAAAFPDWPSSFKDGRDDIRGAWHVLRSLEAALKRAARRKVKPR